MDQKCSNHPDKQAISFCHNCGKYFCYECLNEGKEYYYCNSEECLANYKNEKVSNNTAARKSSYADFGTRFIAHFIDALILFVANSFIAVLLQLKVDDIVIDFGSFVIFRHPIFFLSGLLYFVLLESSKTQATIGKKIMKIVVVDANGERLSILKSFVRNISKILSFAILFIGYLMVVFDKKKQALHDKIAKTYLLKLNYDLLPETYKCSFCHSEVELNYKERLEKEFTCPECNNKNSLVG